MQNLRTQSAGVLRLRTRDVGRKATGPVLQPVMPSIFDSLPHSPAAEVFITLLDEPAVRIERIVSHHHASPAGFWYEQPHGEWVLLLRGAATLRLEKPDESVTLAPGDYLWLAPGRRHRVEATDAQTIWLAVHVHRDGAPRPEETA